MKKGWEYKKLDDICTIVGRIGFRGYTKADLVNSSKDGAITLSPSNIIDGVLDFSKCTYINWDKYYESPEIMLENGDIVLVKTASIGKCAVVKKLPHEATLNPQFVVLKQLVGVPDFICYYLKSPVAQNTIKQMAGGVAIPTLSQKKLGMMTVPTPPLSEQQSIVDYLDSAFAKIDAMKANAEKALNEAKALFQALLKEMLEPKEGWEKKMLKETAKYRRGSFPQPYGNKEWYDGEGSMPFVQVAELQEDSFNLISVTKRRISKLAQPLSVFVPAGTVLVSLQGSIGKVAITNYDSYVDRTVAIFQDYKIEIDKTFFAYQLKSRFEIERLKARGTTIKTITKEEFANFSINCPPLSEQQSIVETLDSLKSKVDHLQENYNKISQECDALKQAILRQVFE